MKGGEIQEVCKGLGDRGGRLINLQTLGIERQMVGCIGDLVFRSWNIRRDGEFD